MKRLLLALLALLTGLAASGMPVLAAVEAKSMASASAQQEPDVVVVRTGVQVRSNPRIGRARYATAALSDTRPVAGPKAPAIQLKADRAHE